MWDEDKRHRFADCERVRKRARFRTRSAPKNLAVLTGELLDLEATYLGRPTQRLRQYREIVEAQNRRLNAIAARKAALVQRLQSVLGEAEAERHAIQDEVEAVLADGRDPQIGG